MSNPTRTKWGWAWRFLLGVVIGLTPGLTYWLVAG